MDKCTSDCALIHWIAGIVSSLFLNRLCTHPLDCSACRLPLLAALHRLWASRSRFARLLGTVPTAPPPTFSQIWFDLHPQHRFLAFLACQHHFLAGFLTGTHFSANLQHPCSIPRLYTVVSPLQAFLSTSNLQIASLIDFSTSPWPISPILQIQNR